MTTTIRTMLDYLLVLPLLLAVKETTSQQQNAGSGVDRWGPWTAWSLCSVSCGQGVVYRKRQCHSTRSSSHCKGDDKHYKICKHNCTSPVRDYRTVECEKYNGRYYGGKPYYWEAFINPYSRCELACKARGPVRYYARFQETVEDGTPCKLDEEAICINGKCLDIGCDGIAGSGATVDQCGVCGGGGKSCQILSGIFTRRHLDKYGYNSITTIPSGACNINITELAKSSNYIALKVGGEHGLYFLNGNHRLSRSGTVRGAGTEFQYGRSQSRDCPGGCLYADGPTNQDVDVKLLYYHNNPGIMYQYTIPKDKMRSVTSHTSEENIDHSKRQTANGHHRNKHRSRGHQNRNHHRSHHSNQDRKSDGNNQHRNNHNRNSHHKSHHGHRVNPQTTAASSVGSSQLNRQQGDMHVDRLHQSRRRLIARRRDHRRLPQPRYIPANDRTQQLQQGERRIIARTYTSSNDHRQPVKAAYGERYSNGQYRTNTATNSHTDSSQPKKPQQHYLPHSQTIRTSRRTSSRHSPRSRTHGSSSSVSRYSPGRSDANRLVNTQNNGVDLYGHQRAVGPANNIQQIPDRRRLSDNYSWKISGFSDCSRTCGGGVQETDIVCVKSSSGFVVTEENCDPNQLPKRQRVTCNSHPCPSGWEPDEWSQCSTTCGKGIQTRTVECKRRISPTLTISVSANLCLHIPRPAVSRMCETKPCAAWKIGKWEKCTTECGLGERTRSVKCVSVAGGHAPDRQCGLPRPEAKEICDMGSCAKGWYHTKWSAQCNTECGAGHYTRKMFCFADDGSYLPGAKCSSGKKPRTKKQCKSNLPCGGKWFAGPWSRCNATCGHSVKSRDVVCMKKLGNKLHAIVSEENCVPEERPLAEEVCGGLEPCRAEWFMTPFGQCSASCNTGTKQREVKCLDSNLQPSSDCPSKLKPSVRHTCNKQKCRDKKLAPAPLTNRHIQKDDGGGGSCKDHSSGRCLYVRQARLCRYAFYKQMCCKSCQEYVSNKHH